MSERNTKAENLNKRRLAGLAMVVGTPWAFFEGLS
jgi:hypothetical protein